jgi:hypothetical protein
MGIYYFAVDHNLKKQMGSPKMFSLSGRNSFSPNNPFPHMVMMENYYGNNFELINDVNSTFEHEYEDVTKETYQKLKDEFPYYNWDECCFIEQESVPNEERLKISEMAKDMNSELKYTNRGFAFYNFEDRNAEKCSLQKSSIIDEEECVWLGRNENAKPHPTLGIEMSPRMLLTQSQAKWLGELLIKFSESGHLNNE